MSSEKENIFSTLLEIHLDKTPVMRYQLGRFVVMAEQYDTDDEPKNIRILGPGRMQVNIAGANALVNALRIAEFMDQNQIKD